MEAYRIDRFGSVDGIVFRSSEDPGPGPKEVLMRVCARFAQLSRSDGPERRRLRSNEGRRSAAVRRRGEVAAIGEGVTRVKIGDRIAGCFHPRWFGGPIKPDYLTDRLGANLDGMLAEYAVFNEEAVVLLPSHLSFEEAATLPCAAVTAWVALTGHRRVTAGDIVLTQGSGGVSVFALQFARPLFGRGPGRCHYRVCDLVPFSGCIVYRTVTHGFSLFTSVVKFLPQGHAWKCLDRVHVDLSWTPKMGQLAKVEPCP
jgi:NADPH:quinone reductase-like Zn-dependent oxidoreductase